MVGGYTFLHEELERRLARLKHTEDCLLFPTGFAANMAVVSALCSSPDVTIFSDELNHASIVDGTRLATRQQVVLHGHIVTRIVCTPHCIAYAAAAIGSPSVRQCSIQSVLERSTIRHCSVIHAACRAS